MNSRFVDFVDATVAESGDIAVLHGEEISARPDLALDHRLTDAEVRANSLVLFTESEGETVVFATYIEYGPELLVRQKFRCQASPDIIRTTSLWEVVPDVSAAYYTLGYSWWSPNHWRKLPEYYGKYTDLLRKVASRFPMFGEETGQMTLGEGEEDIMVTDKMRHYIGKPCLASARVVNIFTKAKFVAVPRLYNFYTLGRVFMNFDHGRCDTEPAVGQPENLS